MKRTYIFLAGLAVLLLIAMGIFFLKFPSVAIEDKDGNGVWDDVDLKIDAQFKNQALRHAARQIAIEYQESIKNPANAKIIERAMARAESCFAYVATKVDPSPINREYSIRDLVVTDREREKQYLRYNVNLSGGVYQLLEEDKTNCKFDTSGL